MEYLQLQPDYCFCSSDFPEALKEYYWDHISGCLGSEEKINQFKNKIIEIIEKSIANFN
ncbi:MAG: hypothetical protein MRECE_33c005 [Mycoplasmataceae bacterium CE_OT135]|nr:MAG: hypothetical protein MRECE_33c005 [Mycoplasmataceae bacterium CE_OT135]